MIFYVIECDLYSFKKSWHLIFFFNLYFVYVCGYVCGMVHVDTLQEQVLCPACPAYGSQAWRQASLPAEQSC